MAHQHDHHWAAHKRELGKRQRRPEIVFVTLPPDFEGPIGGFFTEHAPGVGPPVRPTRTPEPRPSRRPASTSARPTPKRTSTTPERPKSTKETTASNRPSRTTMATSTSDISSDTVNTPTGFNEFRQTGTGTGSPTAITSSDVSSGMSGGAKAGLAIGIILLIGLIAGAALFFIRKKKREKSELTGFDTEKPFGAAARSDSGPGPTVGGSDPPPMTRTMTSPTAPQLNIRPITQFSPDLGGHTTPGNAFSSGNLAPGVAAVGVARSLTGEKPAPPPKTFNNDPNPFNDPVNPFDSPAISSAPATPATPATSATPGTPRVPAAFASGAPPSHIPSPAISDVRTPSPETLVTGVAAVGTAVTAGAVGAVAVRRSLNDGKLQEQPRDGPAPARDSPPPASPAMSVDSTTASAVAGAGAGPGAGPAGPPNVHRVQLDFSPSMEDELELRAGQLVRLMHEYDDGWALCVRLDRSAQGVVPRTCLSSRPVRPRPRNQSNAGPRGPPPMGYPPGGPPSDSGRSMSMSSQMSHHSPNPNGPLTPRFQPPANGRPASPASPAPSSYRTFPPQQHPHPHQPHQNGRPMSPARFPHVPRSLSPGPGRIPQPRSMSPGPYGPGGMNKPAMSATANRRRSHSTSAAMGPGGNPAGPAPVPMPAPQGQDRQQQFALPSATAGFGGYPEQVMPPQPPQVQAQQAPMPAPAPAPMQAQVTPEPSRSPPMSTEPIERKPLPSPAQQ
ncbi:hypothetical protein BDBG_02991 [Blastomyces gilchristii SLH14081]|uniref:SH3 domain-containing protein n=1 Tax=Blastomyces gilchristii (strain SLH14081) TaxID=559298 RepID=A0A179UKB2_BLAGS|nr:uncharacterized protein BDBG_02991 [Blastomyces gilchristii SLH14081]OAT06852.1 hypothetical protein BDBG_02991 [Blastomyces gilchristii SLH14081]